MKKDTIEKILKLIQIFIVTNTLCICTALSFYIFLAFILSIASIPEHIQIFIFIFWSALVILATGYINCFVFFDEFENKERSDD